MEPLLKKFTEVLEQDRKQYIKNWMISWEYQQKRKWAQMKYSPEVITDFFSFNGKEDLIRWINWLPVHPDFINNDKIKDLLQKSQQRDEEIINKLGLTYDFSTYKTNIGIQNAQDYYIPNMLPSKDKISNIVDFGAGYGRQANLWSSPERVYLAIDAIPSSYCLQNLYQSQLGLPYNDYIDAPKQFKLNLEKAGIYHIPTWRTDIVSSNSFDLAICVMVLPELNEVLAKWIIGEFKRILKPGGMLYLRDHGQSIKMVNSFDFDRYLLGNGFSLEYKPHVIDGTDIHGIPRVYRKNNPAVINSQKRPNQKKLKQKVSGLMFTLDYKISKVLGKPYKKLRNK